MAASAWSVHDKAKEYIGNAVINFDTDTFYMILATTGSNLNTTTTDPISAITNEVASGNGYTTGGVALTNPTWTESTGTITFDIDDGSWDAVGGSIVAKYAAIYDFTVSSPVVKPIICSCDLDNGGGSITATDGNTLTVQISASGVFTLS